MLQPGFDVPMMYDDTRIQDNLQEKARIVIFEENLKTLHLNFEWQ